MGRQKKMKPPRSSQERSTSLAEAQAQFPQMLQLANQTMAAHNAARAELDEFHKRVGKFCAGEMNAKERNEARLIYNRLMPKLNSQARFFMKLVNDMKKWRTDAIEGARARKEINAIGIMQARHGCLTILDLDETTDHYGAGAVAWPDNKRLDKDDEVAAFVDATKTWILAEVVGSVSNHRYECIDIDDQDKKIASFARKQLIPLPKYTVFYERYPYMAIQKRGIVLAIFPGTTCFYEGIVHLPPQSVSGMYWIRFVDKDKPDNYGEPVEVSERYVVAFRKDPKMYIRPEKREELAKKLQEGEGQEKADAEKKELEEEAPEEVKVKETPKKKGRKPQVFVEPENPAVTDEKDVPGPAPKPNYYESPDEEEEKKLKKGRKGVKKASKPKKIKVRRAKVPDHKKRVSTRLFGKRRVKRKKAVKGAAAIADGGESSTVKTEEVKETEEGVGEQIYGELVADPSEDVDSTLDEYEDAKAELSNVTGDNDEQKEDEEESSGDSDDDGEDGEKIDNQMEVSGENPEGDNADAVLPEEADEEERERSERSESSSTDSSDSDDSYVNRFNKRPKPAPVVSDSSRSPTPESSDDDVPATRPPHL